MHLGRLGTMMMALVLGCGGGDGDGGPTDPPNGDQTLGSITASPASLVLAAGTTATIAVVAHDTENQVIASPGTPTFTSVNAAIAEVIGAGAVFGIGEGSTQVNVSLARAGVTKTASVAVTVNGTLPTSVGVTAGSDLSFGPTMVAIARGGSVAWTFGSLEHTVSFGGAAGAPASITSGGVSTTISRTFNTNGNFNYTCTIHAGMTGQVIVR